MNRPKFLLILAFVLIAAGAVNIVLAIVDISSGASLANNALSAGLGVLFVLLGVVDLARSRGAR